MNPLAFISRRAIPWMILYEIARVVWDNARRRVEENLSQRERDDFVRILKKSKGRRSNLSARERSRFPRLVRKATTGDPGASWAAVARSLPSLLGPESWSRFARRLLPGGGSA